MRTTALLDRQAEAVVAVGLLLDLVVVVGNACDTATLTILELFELTTGGVSLMTRLARSCL